MSNPTANFGWVMPTATDLVTDLPADFAVFGQAVDTSMAGLLGGTTGQVLSKTSGTNMAFTWVTAQVGDITAVTAGTGISGGGTSGDVTITNSMATAMTTSGDLIQAIGSGTFARLGTGTSGQYLTTNGTTNSWSTPTAGGYTLLSTTNLSGSSTNITGISQSYTDLLIVMNTVAIQTTAGAITFKFRDSSAADITATTIINGIYSDSGAAGTNYIAAYFANLVTTTNLKAVASPNDQAFCFRISNYSESVYGRQIIYSGRYSSSASTNRNESAVGSLGTAAVAGLNIALSAGTFYSGTVKIWGLK